MADDVIFMRRGAALVPLAVAPYDAEDVLQGLLEHHPQLLGGAQMDRADPRRFLLVRREAPVADHEGGGGRWSIDHLFLDQDAVPTLVEVKRSSDTRIRREVVGQMLDYAANGARYWAPDQLHDLFEQTCKEAGKEPADLLTALIGADSDVEEFWSRAGRNLRGGRLRLVFVADVIPDELRAVVEFLQARMADTEVYGVEVRRYAGDGESECFVPRLVGDLVTSEVERRASPSLDELFGHAQSDVVAVRDRLLSWAADHGLQIVSAPKSVQVHDRLGAVTRVYPTFGMLEVPLETVLRAGRAEEAAGVVGDLRQLFKHVTDKAPNIGCSEALANWDRVVPILDRLVAIRDAIG